MRWAERVRADEGDPLLDPATLGPCVPRPSQVFAIGLNYRDHARETGLPEPKQPMVFTKFASCLTGARGRSTHSEAVDWEVELVVVIGKEARRVSDRARARARRRLLRRAGHLGPAPAVRRHAAAVLARQVGSWLRPDRTERGRAPEPRVRDVLAALRRARRRACRTARPTTWSSLCPPSSST